MTNPPSVCRTALSSSLRGVTCPWRNSAGGPAYLSEFQALTSARTSAPAALSAGAAGLFAGLPSPPGSGNRPVARRTAGRTITESAGGRVRRVMERSSGKGPRRTGGGVDPPPYYDEREGAAWGELQACYKGD